MSFRLRTEVALLRRKQTFIKIDADWIKSLRFVCVNRCLFPSINSLIIRTQTKLNNLPNSVLGFSSYVYGVFGAQRSRDCTVTVLVSQI